MTSSVSSSASSSCSRAGASSSDLRPSGAAVAESASSVLFDPEYIGMDAVVDPPHRHGTVSSLSYYTCCSGTSRRDRWMDRASLVWFFVHSAVDLFAGIFFYYPVVRGSPHSPVNPTVTGVEHSDILMVILLVLWTMWAIPQILFPLFGGRYVDLRLDLSDHLEARGVPAKVAADLLETWDKARPPPARSILGMWAVLIAWWTTVYTVELRGYPDKTEMLYACVFALGPVIFWHFFPLTHSQYLLEATTTASAVCRRVAGHIRAGRIGADTAINCLGGLAGSMGRISGAPFGIISVTQSGTSILIAAIAFQYCVLGKWKSPLFVSTFVAQTYQLFVGYAGHLRATSGFITITEAMAERVHAGGNAKIDWDIAYQFAATQGPKAVTVIGQPINGAFFTRLFYLYVLASLYTVRFGLLETLAGLQSTLVSTT